MKVFRVFQDEILGGISLLLAKAWTLGFLAYLIMSLSACAPVSALTESGEVKASCADIAERSGKTVSYYAAESGEAETGPYCKSPMGRVCQIYEMPEKYIQFLCHGGAS